MKKSDLHWVAGLLEGEGCFRRHGAGGTDRNIRIMCHMTDHDVLVQLQNLCGGRINGPYKNGPKRNKPRWAWFIAGQCAYDLMRSLRDLMGKRRKKKIDELMKMFDAVPVKMIKIKNLKTGRVFTITNIMTWCQENNVNYNALWKTRVGERKQANGFRRVA